MALQTLATGNYAIRTTGAFPTPPYTLCFYFMLEQDKNASGCIFGLRDTGNSEGYVYHYNPSGDGTTYEWEQQIGGGGTANLASISLALDTWYFVAINRQGVGANQTIARRKILNESSLLSFTGTFEITAAFNEEIVLTNGFNVAAGFFPGRICGMKCWSASLTENELLAESNTLNLVRSADIFWYRPMNQATVADMLLDTSGNGRHLTEVGTLSGATNPTFVSGSGNSRMILIHNGGSK